LLIFLLATVICKFKRLSIIQIETDGASKGNPGPSGIGVVIKNEAGEVLAQIARYIGITTNNVAEYQALIVGIQEARDRGATELIARTDSELLANQIKGIYKIKAPHLRELADQVHSSARGLTKFTIIHNLRGYNSAADGLANEGVKSGALNS
jgi:ribonuclease HI